MLEQYPSTGTTVRIFSHTLTVVLGLVLYEGRGLDLKIQDKYCFVFLIFPTFGCPLLSEGREI